MGRKEKVVIALFFGAFLAAGLAVGKSTIDDLRLAAIANGWPVASGTVTHSEVKSRRAKRARHELRYRFEVDGQTYAGHRVAFRDGLIRYKTTERAERFPVGRQVDVHYAPGDPRSSVLETGVFWPGVLFHGLATFVLLAAGGGGMMWALRRPES